jgi:hypothetical protein
MTYTTSFGEPIFSGKEASQPVVRASSNPFLFVIILDEVHRSQSGSGGMLRHPGPLIAAPFDWIGPDRTAPLFPARLPVSANHLAGLWAFQALFCASCRKAHAKAGSSA